MEWKPYLSCCFDDVNAHSLHGRSCHQRMPTGIGRANTCFAKFAGAADQTCRQGIPLGKSSPFQFMDDLVKSQTLLPSLGLGDISIFLVDQLDEEGPGISCCRLSKFLDRREIGGAHQVLIIFIAEGHQTFQTDPFINNNGADRNHLCRCGPQLNCYISELANVCFPHGI